MSTLELLQLQNEHKDNFFGKGEEMKNHYFIFDNMDKQGNGVSVWIDDGTLFVEIIDECGYACGEWECGIEILKYHIAKYEQGLKGE